MRKRSCCCSMKVPGKLIASSLSCRLAVLLQVTPERLAGLNARLRGVRLGNFYFVSEGLHLGAASGNRFQVPG